MHIFILDSFQILNVDKCPPRAFTYHSSLFQSEFTSCDSRVQHFCVTFHCRTFSYIISLMNENNPLQPNNFQSEPTNNGLNRSNIGLGDSLIPPHPPSAPTPASINTPLPPQKPTSVPDANIKTLRTFEGDVAELLAKKKVNLASMVIAENNKTEGSEFIANTESATDTSFGTMTKIVLAIIIMLLLAGGIYGAYYLYMKSPLAPSPITAPVAPLIQSIIPKDSQVVISIDNKMPVDIMAEISKEIYKDQPANTIKEIIFVASKTNSSSTSPSSNKNLQISRISIQQALNILGINPPGIFTRSLAQDWMFGIYSDQSSEKHIFMALTTDFFQNSFSGMIQWEDVMVDDLKFYLFPDGEQYFTVRGGFEDRIIENKDVRTFITEENSILFMYSFIDNNRLIFARDGSVLKEVIRRLEKQGFVR